MHPCFCLSTSLRRTSKHAWTNQKQRSLSLYLPGGDKSLKLYPFDKAKPSDSQIVRRHSNTEVPDRSVMESGVWKNPIHNPPNKPVCIKSVKPSRAGWRRRPSTLSDRAAEAKPGGELVAVRRDDAAAEFLRAWRGTHEAEEAEADDETGVKHGALLITVRHWQAHYS